MTNGPLIGLIGKKGSGKDTFGLRLVEKWGFTRLAFADPVKQLAAELNPIMGIRGDGGDYRLIDILDAWGGWDGAKHMLDVRTLLQDVGMAVRHCVDENAWVAATANRRAYTEGPVVITDVRFRNEYEWVLGQGGVLVRITRDGLTHDPHISENEVNDVAVAAEIVNSGTVTDLHSHADILGELLTPVRA